MKWQHTQKGFLEEPCKDFTFTSYVDKDKTGYSYYNNNDSHAINSSRSFLERSRKDATRRRKLQALRSTTRSQLHIQDSTNNRWSPRYNYHSTIPRGLWHHSCLFSQCLFFPMNGGRIRNTWTFGETSFRHSENTNTSFFQYYTTMWIRTIPILYIESTVAQ